MSQYSDDIGSNMAEGRDAGHRRTTGFDRPAAPPSDEELSASAAAETERYLSDWRNRLRENVGVWLPLYGPASDAFREAMTPKDRGSIVLEVKPDPEGGDMIRYRETLTVPRPKR